MCRNIRQLRHPDGQPTDDELWDAALQFVRKVTGYRIPSRKNQEAFDRAVEEIASVAKKLFQALEVNRTS